jgi:hypothetical protein
VDVAALLRAAVASVTDLRAQVLLFHLLFALPPLHAATRIPTGVLLPRDMKNTFSVILLLLCSSWSAASGASLHPQTGKVYTYSATPTVRAKTHPYEEQTNSQRKQKKDEAYKRSVRRQRARTHHIRFETACCCKAASGVQIGSTAFHFFPAVSLSAYYIPSLVRKRGPPAV